MFFLGRISPTTVKVMFVESKGCVFVPSVSPPNGKIGLVVKVSFFTARVIKSLFVFSEIKPQFFKLTMSVR